MSVVNVVCCQVEVCDELITRPEKSYRLWCVVVCDLETSFMRRPWPTGGFCARNRLSYTALRCKVINHCSFKVLSWVLKPMDARLYSCNNFKTTFPNWTYCKVSFVWQQTECTGTEHLWVSEKSVRWKQWSPRPLPSASFPVCYSVIALLFNAIGLRDNQRYWKCHKVQAYK